MNVLYHIGKFLLAPGLCFLFRLRVTGAGDIPRQGGLILCCNHRSVLDPCLLAVAFRRPIRFMAKSELFEDHTAMAGKLLTALGAFPVTRDSGSAHAMKTAVSVVENGEVVGIFPQGRCVPAHIPIRAKAGAAWIACTTGVPLLPACISWKGKLRPFRKVTIRFGEPFLVDAANEDALRYKQREAARKISERINSLLEEKT